MRARCPAVLGTIAPLLLLGEGGPDRIAGLGGADQLSGEDTVNVARWNGNRRRVEVAGDCEHIKRG